MKQLNYLRQRWRVIFFACATLQLNQLNAQRAILTTVSNRMSYAWSPDGKYILVNMFSSLDKTMHLCAYGITIFNFSKCILKINLSGKISDWGDVKWNDMIIETIYWTDNEITYSLCPNQDRCSIYKADVSGWRNKGYVERSNSQFVTVGDSPVWDRAHNMLFFTNHTDNLHKRSIYVKKHNKIQEVEQLATAPFMDKNYIYYTKLTSDNFNPAGIMRLNKSNFADKKQLTFGFDYNGTILKNGLLCFLRSSGELDGKFSIILFDIDSGEERQKINIDSKNEQSDLNLKFSPSGDNFLVSIYHSTWIEKNPLSGKPRRFMDDLNIFSYVYTLFLYDFKGLSNE
ncbi:MAG: hypothetical protein OEV66_12625 [Spirochaetia bacterium]|nr:hypothetical protein [Spirochaetia bacterium]